MDGNGSTDDGDAGLDGGFPAGFLRRTDERADGVFYEPARLVQRASGNDGGLDLGSKAGIDAA